MVNCFNAYKLFGQWNWLDWRINKLNRVTNELIFILLLFVFLFLTLHIFLTLYERLLFINIRVFHFWQLFLIRHFSFGLYFYSTSSLSKPSFWWPGSYCMCTWNLSIRIFFRIIAPVNGFIISFIEFIKKVSFDLFFLLLLRNLKVRNTNGNGLDFFIGIVVGIVDLIKLSHLNSIKI